MAKKETEKKLKLLEEADLINRSIKWWNKQMDKVFDEIDRLDPNDLRKMLALEKKVIVLIGKGETEVKNIDSWIKRSKA